MSAREHGWWMSAQASVNRVNGAHRDQHTLSLLVVAVLELVGVEVVVMNRRAAQIVVGVAGGAVVLTGFAGMFVGTTTSSPDTATAASAGPVAGPNPAPTVTDPALVPAAVAEAIASFDTGLVTVDEATRRVEQAGGYVGMAVVNGQSTESVTRSSGVRVVLVAEGPETAPLVQTASITQ